MRNDVAGCYIYVHCSPCNVLWRILRRSDNKIAYLDPCFEPLSASCRAIEVINGLEYRYMSCY